MDANANNNNKKSRNMVWSDDHAVAEYLRSARQESSPCYDRVWGRFVDLTDPAPLSYKFNNVFPHVTDPAPLTYNFNNVFPCGGVHRAYPEPLFVPPPSARKQDFGEEYPEALVCGNALNVYLESCAVVQQAMAARQVVTAANALAPRTCVPPTTSEPKIRKRPVPLPGPPREAPLTAAAAPAALAVPVIPSAPKIHKRPIPKQLIELQAVNGLIKELGDIDLDDGYESDDWMGIGACEHWTCDGVTPSLAGSEM